MDPKNRFKRIREQRKARGFCERCGHEKARPGGRICILCETEIRTKKIVAPSRRIRCEKIGRLERNLAIVREADRTISAKLAALRAG